jgi:O-antigen/teichoic acid export membrane protein
VPWIVLGHLFYTTAIIVEIAFYIAKKTNMLAWVNGVAAIINLVGNVFAIPLGGILAAAIITTITYGFQLGCYLLISKRILRWDIPQPNTTGGILILPEKKYFSFRRSLRK